MNQIDLEGIHYRNWRNEKDGEVIEFLGPVPDGEFLLDIQLEMWKESLKRPSHFRRG